MGRRRAKPEKVSLADSSSSSSSDEDEDDEDPSPPPSAEGSARTNKRETKKKKAEVIDVSNETVQRPRNVGNYASEIVENNGKYEAPDDDDPPEDEEAFLKQAPFCCSRCRCSQELKQRLKEEDNRYFLPGDNAPWHRVCCHGHHNKSLDRSEHWSLPFRTALEEAEEYLTSGIPEKADTEQDAASFPRAFSAPMEWVTKGLIEKAYEEARRRQAMVYNNDNLETPLTKLHTSEEYMEGIVKPFKIYEQKINTKKELDKTGITVLDCFAGIGTAIVVLKHLGIKIAKVIHVEHDKVATHVYRYNHDREYNPSLPDDGGIKHVYCRSFEKLEKDGMPEKLLKKHGPIDLVIGGPPCIDYSGANANRQGVKGEQGSYMTRFGSLIRTLERLQELGESQRKLFFLVENVIFKGDDLASIRDAFGIDWDPIEFDALYASPTCRGRHFITNISLELNGFEFDGPASHADPSKCCLEEGLVLPGKVVQPDMPIAKAACFMASSSRIDDPNTLRMYVYHPEPKWVKTKDEVKEEKAYLGRPMNTNERELIMGYPADYVRSAVFKLFCTLLSDGLSKSVTKDINLWRTEMDEKFHTFQGNYHGIKDSDPYSFAVSNEGEIIMRMAPPQTTSKPYFFDADEYSKHLLGLAYVVPVVELLLAPLQRLFLPRSYPGYCYRYAWVPAEDGDGKEDARSCLQSQSRPCSNENDDDDRKMPARTTNACAPAATSTNANDAQSMMTSVPAGHRKPAPKVTEDQNISVTANVHRKPVPEDDSWEKAAGKRPPEPRLKDPPHDSNYDSNRTAEDSRKRLKQAPRHPQLDAAHSGSSIEAPIPKKLKNGQSHPPPDAAFNGNIDAPIPKKQKRPDCDRR